MSTALQKQSSIFSGYRIMVMVSLAVVALYSLYGYQQYVSDKAGEEAALTLRADRDAGMLSSALVRPLLESDGGQIEELATEVLAHSYVSGIDVLDRKNKPLKKLYKPDSPDVPFTTSTHSISYVDGGKTKVLGSITLRVSGEQLQKRLEGRAWNLVRIVAVFLVLQALLTYLLLRLMARENEVIGMADKEKYELLLDIINNAVDGLITINEFGIVQMFSPACEKIFGYKAEEVIGKNVSLLMPEPHNKEHDHYIQEYLRTGRTKVIGISREMLGRHKDGTRIHIELSIRDLKLHGKRLFSAGVRDISERKSVEDQLNTYLVEVEWLRAEAEKGARLKSEFLATMSHEIRTPISGVLGMTELLLLSKLSAQQEHYAKIAMRSAHALLNIINDILDFSKIEAGLLMLEPQPIDLKVLAQEAIELFSLKADEKGLILALTYADNVPRYVLGDAGRIRQILSNLISNALKFTHKGRVDLIVEDVALPQARLNEVKMKISVKDTGMGIPQDVQGVLFNKFTQADASTTRKYGGTGLGLAICKQLAASMGGDVGIRSTLGEGSTFWFTMQLPLVDKSAIVVALPEPVEREGRESLRNLRVLMVEDNLNNLEFALAFLKNMGCKTTVAKDGQQAIGYVQDKNTYDAILMDCEMPIMDGYEVTRTLRDYYKKHNSPHVPIIAMTANVMKGAREKCIAAGMDDYLPKPFLKKDLAAILAKWSKGVSK